jgi:hypothetical protein
MHEKKSVELKPQPKRSGHPARLNLKPQNGVARLVVMGRGKSAVGREVARLGWKNPEYWTRKRKNHATWKEREKKSACREQLGPLKAFRQQSHTTCFLFRSLPCHFLTFLLRGTPFLVHSIVLRFSPHKIPPGLDKTATSWAAA